MVVKDAEEYYSLIKEFEKTSRIIDARIAECASGHLKPIPEKNKCNYCFQHLVYSTSETTAILKEREKFPLSSNPHDASKLIQFLSEEISVQKRADRLKGIEELMDMKTLEISVQ